MPLQYLMTVLSATFLGAIAQDAGSDADLVMPRALQGAAQSARSLLRSIVIISEENIAWELWLWRNAARAGATYDADSWLGRWSFVTSDAVRKTGDTRYRYFIPDLDVPYEDLDQLGQLHVTLIPRGAAKVINTSIVLKFAFETQGAGGN